MKLTRRQLALVEERDPAVAIQLYRLVAQSLARSLSALSGPPPGDSLKPRA
jgi:hypothetical protein